MISRKRLAWKLLDSDNKSPCCIGDLRKLHELDATVLRAEELGGALAYKGAYLFHKRGGLWVIYAPQTKTMEQAHKKLLE